MRQSTEYAAARSDVGGVALALLAIFGPGFAKPCLTSGAALTTLSSSSKTVADFPSRRFLSNLFVYLRAGGQYAACPVVHSPVRENPYFFVCCPTSGAHRHADGSELFIFIQASEQHECASASAPASTTAPASATDSAPFSATDSRAFS